MRRINTTIIENYRKILLTLFIIVTSFLTAVQLTVSAQGEQLLDLSNGSIVITSTGYSQGGSAITAHTGGYIITGSTGAHTVQIQSGAHNIILDNINLAIPASTATSATAADTVCAFSVAGNADVTVTLRGGNTVASAAGYAGIYVAEGARLTIVGDGSLTAQGGAGRPSSTGTPSYGGGAGIGGNGYESSSRFGTVVIDAGNVTATGGVTSKSVNYGAGAGIGSGGSTDNPGPAYPSPDGTILINGGMVNVYGGACVNTSDSCGGAGLGSGGCNGEMNSYISISIHGGTVNAHGTNDGAGIGGGANCHSSGAILIDGGMIAAYGGDEGDGSTWGGAGIGGGDMGWARAISIGGSAKVSAYGGGAAAGIGGGNCGGIWDLDSDVVGEITLYGNAVVTAVGGSSGTTRGGAGIGAGRTMYPSLPCNSGAVTIKDDANVTAYAGIGAQAVGVGSGYDYNAASPGEDLLIIEDRINLRLFNQDAARAAYPPTVQGGIAPSLIAFTLSESGQGSFPGTAASTDVTRGANSLTWEYSGTSGAYTLTLFDNGSPIGDFQSAHVAFGNWAVLSSPVSSQAAYTVEYYYNNSIDPNETVTGTEDVGVTINDYPPKPRVGYTLDRTENLPLAISNNPADNIIKVYYVLSLSSSSQPETSSTEVSETSSAPPKVSEVPVNPPVTSEASSAPPAASEGQSTSPKKPLNENPNTGGGALR